MADSKQVRAPLKHQLTEKQFSIIGKIAVESALTEVLIEVLITKLASQKDVGVTRIMLGSMLTGGKIDILGKLIVLLPFEDQSSFKELMNDVGHANGQRKLPIHGVWAQSVEDGIVRANSIKKDKSTPLAATELGSIWELYKSVNQRFIAMLMRDTMKVQKTPKHRKSTK